MSSDKRMHVLGLTPREQLLVRILLSNLIAGYIDKSIQEAVDYKTVDAADRRASNAVNFFWRYNEFCDMLCSESTVSRAKSKVLMVEPTMMKYLLLSANGYDPRNCMLSDKNIEWLNTGFDQLKQKIVDSSYFLYDRWEIDLAKKS